METTKNLIIHVSFTGGAQEIVDQKKGYVDALVGSCVDLDEGLVRKRLEILVNKVSEIACDVKTGVRQVISRQ